MNRNLMLLLFCVSFCFLINHSNAQQLEVFELTRADSAEVLSNDEKAQRELENEDWKEASRYYNQNGLIYWNHNYLQTAISYYQKSRVLNEKIQNASGLAMLGNNFGMIYADLGEYETSLGYFKQTLAARRFQKEKIGIISSIINISVVLNNLERYEESIEYLEEAVIYARELNDPEQLRLCYGVIAETYTKLGDSENAFKYFNLYRTFFEFVEEQKVNESKAQALATKKELRILELEHQNQELALKLQEGIIQEQDSLNSDLRSKMSRAELVIENQNSEIKIKHLLEEKAIKQEEELARNRKFQLIIIIISIILVFMVINIYRSKLIQNRLNIKISDQNNQLNELMKAKDGFTKMLVHDMKTPLTAISNFIPNVDQGIARDTVRNATNQMIYSVENLLDIQRYEQRSMPLHKKECNLNDLIETAREAVFFISDAKSVTIDIQSKHKYLVQVDPNVIQRVLINLLTNAIKYSPQNSKVRILLDVVDEKLHISVCDQGFGIAKEDIPKLFKMFSQVSPKDSKKFKSSGIGLAFCKLAIESHNNRIYIDSEYTKGCKIVFTLDAIQVDAIKTIQAKQKSPQLQLNGADRAYLESFVKDIQQYEIFELSNIRKVLTEVEDRSPSIQEWKTQINSSLMQMNEVKLNELLEINET